MTPIVTALVIFGAGVVGVLLAYFVRWWWLLPLTDRLDAIAAELRAVRRDQDLPR